MTPSGSTWGAPKSDLLPRIAGMLYLVAATIAVVASQIGAIAERPTELLVIAAVGYALGAWLVIRGRALSVPQFHGVGLVGSLLVSLAIVASPGAWQAYVPFYAWILFFFATLAGRAGLVLQLAAVAGGLFGAFLVSGQSASQHLLGLWWVLAAAGGSGLVYWLRKHFGRRFQQERDALAAELHEELRVRLQQDAQYTSLVNNIPGVVYRCEVGHGWRTIQISDGVAGLTGYSKESFERGERVFGELIHAHDLEEVKQVADEAVAARQAYQSSYRVTRADGSVRWVEDWARPVEIDGRVVLDGVLFDITANMEARREIERIDAEYRRLIEALPLVTYVDQLMPGAPTDFISPQIVELLGYSQEEWLRNANLWEALLHPDDREIALQENDMHNRTGRPFSLEYRLRTKDGVYRWFRDEAIVDNGLDGTPAASRGFLIDITNQKELEQQLAHHAFHDSLTDLPNRSLLLDRLRHALSRRGADGIALVYVDVDDFKAVNDSQGHGAGDELLIQLARRLQTCVRVGDTVARLGGDEFVLLFDDGGETVALEVAEKIKEALRAPVQLPQGAVRVSASIGVTGRTPSSDHDTLLRQADLAMYEAKRMGKGQVCLYSPDLAVRATDRLDIRGALEQALELHELELFYQPIVELRSGDIAGFEALIRWHHPERGLLLPGSFLPSIQGTELARKLGRWTVEEATRVLAELQRVGGNDTFVSVNVSAHDLSDDDFAPHVLSCLARQSTRSSRLVLELVEQELIADPGMAIDRLRPLRATGVRVAIDDFGTGYSALGQLDRLPLDIVKLPREMIEGLPDDDQRTHVVTRLLELCNDLDLALVAEGMEFERQVAALREYGCRYGQGFHFAPALPEPAIYDLVGAAAVRGRWRRRATGPTLPGGRFLTPARP